HHYTQTRVDFQQIFRTSVSSRKRQFLQILGNSTIFSGTLHTLCQSGFFRSETNDGIAFRLDAVVCLPGASFFALSQVTVDFPGFARMHASRCESEWNGYALEFLPAFLPFA